MKLVPQGPVCSDLPSARHGLDCCCDTCPIVQIPVDENLLAVAGVDAAHVGEEVRLLAAAKLFELRRLSLRQAAQFAALPLSDFMSELGRLEISWLTLSEDEMNHDIAVA